MRHLVKGRKLNRTASHRVALKRNLAMSLIEHKSIKTTLQKAKELMMTTKEIDGESMKNLGMLYKLTQKENLDSELSDLIDLLNEQSFISICMIKDQIKQGLDLSFTETLDLEGDNQNKRFIHTDAVEGMAAFVEKRKPNYKDTLDN